MRVAAAAAAAKLDDFAGVIDYYYSVSLSVVLQKNGCLHKETWVEGAKKTNLGLAAIALYPHCVRQSHI